MNLEPCTGSCVKSKLLSLLFLPCSKSIRQIFLRMLERLDFADFEIQSGWLLMYVPVFLFVNVFVREMMKSHSVLGLVIRLIFPFLHLSFIIWWNVNTNRCWIFLFNSRFCCVFVCTLRIGIHLELWFVYIREHDENTWISPLGNFLSGICTKLAFRFSWLTFTSKCWCSFSASVIATFSATFRVSVRWTKASLPSAFLVRVMLECACFSTWSLASSWSNGCSLLSRCCFFAFYLPFPFAFSLGRSSYCRFVLVSVSRFHMKILDFLLEMSLGHQLQSCNNHTSCRQLSSLERRLATSISILPTSELVSGTDSPILSIRLSVTDDHTSSHFVSKSWTSSFSNLFWDKCFKSEMA